MKKMAERNMMLDTFQPEIDKLSDKLKKLISESAVIKKSILDKILTIQNNECREIMTKRYIELKTVSRISREMFISRQGVYYHLDVGEKAILSLI